MGCADVIPGVSGGTVALILGIYQELIASIRLLDFKFLRSIFTRMFWKLLFQSVFGKARSPQSAMDRRIRAATFVGFLVLGIVAAIVAAAGLITYCRDNYPEQTRGLFIGLVAASLVVPYRRMNSRGAVQWLSFCLFAVGTWLLLGLGGVSAQEPSLWYVALTGAVAICAMILPGISGAFILLMLGTYGYILGQVKALAYDQHLASLLPIGLFICGILVGIVAFSRLLHYLLRRQHDAAMAGLLGLMVGSLRVLWPFKEQVTDSSLRVEFMANRLPQFSEPAFVPTLITVAAGIGLVVLLDRIGKRTGGGAA